VRQESKRDSEPDAVLIVGVSRSGTSITRDIFNKHSRIAIANENHYLGHLLPWEGARHYFRRLGDMNNDDVVRALVEFIYSGEFRRRSRLRDVSAYWYWLKREVPREEIQDLLLASDRSEKGIWEAFLRVYANRRGKVIIGEKTPTHLAYVETLLAWFPDARIIHCMRDPRAIYVSELRRRVRPLWTATGRAETFPYRWLAKVPPLMKWFVLVQVVWAWAAAVHRHRTLSECYRSRYRLLRFEELVASPKETLEDVCQFIGVDFEPQMLEQEVTSEGARVGEIGFDAGAADRWRTRIGPGAKWAIESLLGHRLEEMGYSATD